jgi:photosystem II biogenesis protein Psp29
VNNVRTVSDTKRAFYTLHTRPINSIYRRVVEELMVEMHLLSVNVDFRYDPFYALGVVTSFNRFMQGYNPEADKASIFDALCKSIEADPQKYRQESERLLNLARSLSAKELISWLGQSHVVSDAMDLQAQARAIATNPKFKYSRLFAIGLFSLLELSEPDLVKDDARRTDAIKQISATLNLSEEKLAKDLDLYRSNLEKMTQALIAMEDALKADRKKREEREQAKAASTPTGSSEPSEGATGS